MSRKTRNDRLRRRRRERAEKKGPSLTPSGNGRRKHVTFRGHRTAKQREHHIAGRLMINGTEHSETDFAAQEYLTRINHEIPLEFTGDAVMEATRLARSAPPLPESSGTSSDFATGARRVNLCDLPFITIDGEDAKDFDDAVCVEKHNGNYFLWVAIADVSLYVQPRSHIDKDALIRGTSYYFPGSVTPMLPEILCNDLCSLRPGKDRPVMAVRLLCRADGTVRKTDFAPAVIRSRARLTYTTVQSFFDGGQPVISEDIGVMLDHAHQLTMAMMERRDERGALDLDLPEAFFTVRRGRVIGVAIRERLFSHRLIETFMIAANEAVAAFLCGKGIPFPMRTHPAPESNRLTSLFTLLRNAILGARMPDVGEDPASPRTITAILAAAADVGKSGPVSRLILRSIMQARYVPGPAEGTAALHYGLASSGYCHFTSPIRRYADLMVHRALKLALGLPDATAIPARQKLAAKCDRCNETERAAQDAEREITKRLVCLLLRDRIGETFDAVVTGVLDFGFFVEPKGYPADGLVRLADLQDDWYAVDATGQQLIGSRTQRRIVIGDTIRVRLVSVSVGRLEMDFIPEPEARRRM